jgi:hypothetical protein
VSWVKLDDTFPRHPKVWGLSHGAFHLHVAALCHCGQYLTDGMVEEGIVRTLVSAYRTSFVRELCVAGLWIKRECGYEIRDYLDYNPTKEKVLAERDAAAERKAKWKAKNAVPSASGTLPRPDPTRPEGPRVGELLTSVLDDEPAPAGGSSRLSEEQIAMNVSAARAARESLKGA